MSDRFVAIDLGASSGRVMLAEIALRQLHLTEVHRFANEPVHTPDGLQWDILRIYSEIKIGLRKAAASGPIRSIAIDSWAVDFGLLDADGRLLANPMHYRDHRTESVIGAVHTAVTRREFYARTGLQFLPFNTVYQLASLRGSAQLGAARTLLLIPDLITYWLTGELGAELTNASTTQLLDVHTGEWAQDLIIRLGLPVAIFPPIRRAGTLIGNLRSELATELGSERIPVIAVGSHDTASAVVAVPSTTGDTRDGDTCDGDTCFIASGTWSLVGLELSAPILSDASQAANFSNEGGVDATIRYLRNVMGLWLLQQSLASWRDAGNDPDLLKLLDEAATLPGLASVFDCDLEAFLPPGDMPARISEACRAAGEMSPQTMAEYVRAILDSLALGYRRVVQLAEQLSGRTIKVVHIVGGGSQNTLLCQLTADALDLPVVAGPVEASALGNVLMQARAAGVLAGDLQSLRALVRATHDLTTYLPRAGNQAEWDAAAAKIASR